MNTHSLINRPVSAKRFTLYPELEKASIKGKIRERKQPGHLLRPLKYNSIADRISELVEAHMDDEQYSIDQLCRDACISRSNLHKKLKAATGLSTSLFIRSVKLKWAKELLKNTDLNITQVAYATGFKDPTYFSRIFSQSFKISPKDFRKSTAFYTGVYQG